MWGIWIRICRGRGVVGIVGVIGVGVGCCCASSGYGQDGTPWKC